MKENKKSVQSVDRALKIIEIVKDRPNGIGVTELSDILNVSKSTVHRLLMSLYKADFIQQNSENKKYFLGLRFIELGEIVSRELDIQELVHPFLQELGEVTDETAHLAIKNRNQIFYIDKIESSKTIRMFSNIGKRAPMYCTGIGKAVLAFLPENEIKQVLAETELIKYTDNTLTTKAEILQELAEIRDRGYAIDNEEHELKIKCAAAPILNYKKEVVAGISVASPVMRLDEEKFKIIINEVLKASKKASEKLGYVAE